MDSAIPNEPRRLNSHPTIDGEIIADGATFNNQFRVRLATGEEITAAIQNRRKFGCLFGSLTHWRVKVVIHAAPKMARIVELTRPSIEP